MKIGTNNPQKYKGSTALYRGLVGLCPSCGSGRLFSSYLKPVVTCSACGEPFGALNVDDGPAWLTILLLGPLLVPLALILTFKTTLPTWLSLSIMIVVAIVATLLLLPRVKGGFIALFWILERKSLGTSL